MASQRIDIASIRRDQIVEAAVAIIAEQGLQNLSLSEIEKRARMSRGQLTYYFPTKEAILLAVFDRLLLLMYQRVGDPDQQPCTQGGGWPRVQFIIEKVVQQAPVSREFHGLQYTFLSQIGHRADFRQRLASLYEEWRSRMAEDLEQEIAERPALRKQSPRLLASFIQAILHGVTMQLAADPGAFERSAMLGLCLDVLNTYLGNMAPCLEARKSKARKKTATNGSHGVRAARSSSAARRAARKGYNHE